MSEEKRAMDEKRAQQLYERMMALQEQAQTLQEHLRRMHEQLQAIGQTVDAITDLEKLTEPKSTWIPIAPGAYVRGTIEPATTVLLSIGAETAVEKKPSEVIATLKEHHKTLDELGEGAVTELKELYAEMDKIKQEVEKSDLAAPGPQRD